MENLNVSPTNTTTSSLTGESVTETTQQCITETMLDPTSMMKEQNCELLSEELEGDTLRFSMECEIQGMKSTSNGVIQTDGENSEGSMNINMNLGEMIMTMDLNWVATRIGDC